MPTHLTDSMSARASLRAPLHGGAADATKARLLAAAEALLAERGFAGMSIRALAARAGTSISAAHYHFGSKQALVVAVFEARIAPINALRLARLEALVSSAAPDDPALEDVIETFVRTGFEAWREGEALGRTATPHVLAQLHAERAPRLEEVKRRLLEPVMDRYTEVVSRILPDQPPATLRVGIGLVLGMLLHVMGGHLEPTLRAAGVSDVRDDEALLAQLIAFGAAGLRATSVPKRSSSGGTA